MSEEIDFEANSLCATEEAFENFQANSMYEEDEFITLSDIVPPKPNIPDLESTLEEMPSENDVVSSTYDEVCFESSQSKIASDQNNICVNADEISNKAQKLKSPRKISRSSAKQLTRKHLPKYTGKAVKKQKTSIEGITEEEIDNDKESKNKISTPDIVIKGTRKKSKNIAAGGVTEKDAFKLPVKEFICNKQSSEFATEIKKSRNKSKRNLTNLVTEEHTMTLPAEDKLLNDKISESSAIETKGSRKKYKKNLTNMVAEEHSIELPVKESAVQGESSAKEQFPVGDPEHFKKNQNKNSRNSALSQNKSFITKNGKTKKPRGKSKKKPFENITINKDKAPVLDKDESNEMSDDDMEDISLSRLKETFEAQVCSVSSPIKLQEQPISNEIDKIVKNTEEAVNDKLETCDLNASEELSNKILNDDNIQGHENIENNNIQENLEEGEHLSSSSDYPHTEGSKKNCSKRKSKSSLKDDYEYNIDKILTDVDTKETTGEQMSTNTTANEVSEADTSKRPTRKKAKQTHYEVESDEDPFANVELSDDEPRKNKGYNRYDYDDEYKPGGKYDQISTDSDSAVEEDYDVDLEIVRKQKRKRTRKKSDGGFLSKSPKKKSKKNDSNFPNVTTISPDENCQPDDDIEGCLQSSVIKTSEDSNPISKPWGTTHEFENFLAKKIHGSDLKIKKVTATASSDNIITPLEIPVIDPNEAKKVTEISTQTERVFKKSALVQTEMPNTVPMKDNIALTPIQSQNACEFLTSVVRTTAELGQLMTQKSEDFIKKKINTEHVKDTFKMDYCVNKSFLLLKLAKHNLSQMEADLSKQYEDFLRTNNLLSCREQVKKVTPKIKETNSDSDCEIVGETTQLIKTEQKQVTKKEKPKFNPKTVFLNKELSIKIAKKPTEESKSKEKINIKGRHTVWISDSVMVKKVKSSQSFLAQDSRNKKPPDNYVTEKMVRDFFDDYYKMKSKSICASFVTTEWLHFDKGVTCNYFFVNADKFSTDVGHSTSNTLLMNGTENNNANVNNSCETKCNITETSKSCPKTLLSLSMNTLQKHLYCSDIDSTIICKYVSDRINCFNKMSSPKTLLKLCLKSFSKNHSAKEAVMVQRNEYSEQDILVTKHNKDSLQGNFKNTQGSLCSPETLIQLCLKSLSKSYIANTVVMVPINEYSEKDIQVTMHNDDTLQDKCKNTHGSLYSPENLLQSCLKSLSKDHSAKTAEMAQRNEYSERDIKVTMHNYYSLQNSSKIELDTLCKKKSLEINIPETLIQLCLKTLSKKLQVKEVLVICEQDIESRSRNEKTPPYQTLEHLPSSQNGEYCNNCYIKKMDYLMRRNTPETLFKQCIKIWSDKYLRNKKTIIHIQDNGRKPMISNLLPTLNNLCHKRIVKSLGIDEDNRVMGKIDKCKPASALYLSAHCNKVIKPLSQLCLELVQQEQKYHLFNSNISSPTSLAKIAFENVRYLLYRNIIFDSNKVVDGAVTKPGKIIINNVKALAEICFEFLSRYFDNYTPTETIDTVTINAVNTMSEEAFHSIEETDTDSQNNLQYGDDDENNFDQDDFHSNIGDFSEDSQTLGTNWASQLHMEGLRSCLIPTKSIKSVKKDQHSMENHSIIARIKIEPLEDVSDNIDQHIQQNIKSEPIHNLDEMIMIPENIVTKQETAEYSSNVTEDPLPRSSYDIDAFEAFLSSSKLMRSINPDFNDEIFSQSASRIRRQYEPDSDNENDTSMSLLVPQTYECLNVEAAKGTLMESSSDEGTASNKKATLKEKKKSDKRRGRPKRADTKNNKDIPITVKETHISKETTSSKEKTGFNNEVAMITRKMKERIRQEEKKNLSSDSENENVPLSMRKEKENDKQKSSKISKETEAEIQCNNVDSTEQVLDSSNNENVKGTTFSGFSAIDQNEIASYEKYMKFVYDKIIPKVTSEVHSNEQNCLQVIQSKEDSLHDDTPIMDPNEPSELVVCEPTIPNFNDESSKKVKKPKSESKSFIKTRLESKGKVTDESIAVNQMTSVTEMRSKEEIIKVRKAKVVPKEQTTELNIAQEPTKFMCNVETTDIKEEITEPNNQKNIVQETPQFIERHGWKCYPINTHDQKLYQLAYIPLEKLPESFVETYFQYQHITDMSIEDAEVDRLTNLQSLKRLTSRDATNKIRQKSKSSTEEQSTASIFDEDIDRDSPAHSDHYDELTPSEDEGGIDDSGVLPPANNQSTENCLAKNSLMNDNDSDAEEAQPLIIKQEPMDEVTPIKRSRPGPKSKCKVEKELSPQSLMLTADKMMNKELTLLHAPIVLSDPVQQTPVKGSQPKTKQKSASKSQEKKDRIKSGDESSEEEKQWVTTKEKLLKRLIKKQEDTSVDDAKRAKLVSEYIERRGALPAPEARIKSRGRCRRSKKKMLERQKQLSVLSRELFGESSNHSGKKHSHTIFKGRRNIRKVIDKKSLARSTVVANMEEFERKRRLSVLQNKLRETLGCEEGVNVLVINGEVCLEYDFDKLRPVVTIHPFFTKVMKAHQYEGVKFMWDACFESLAMVESGHLGGGCILAHCMGLGKTLQVLALLHTVLTHPRVGMQRVLVCCPLSTVLNWVDEIHKWIGPVTDQIKVFELSKLKKTYERAYQLEDWYKGGGIFIIGYELFRSLTTLDPVLDGVKQPIINKIRTALLDPGPDIIVCDEGHLLKNDCSVLAVAMSRVVTKRRIVLTGTPMQNNLREYYCMVNFVKPNLLGTYSEYSNRFENPIMNGQHRDSQEDDIKLMKARTHILHKVLEGCLQRQEASVLYPYLPKKHEYTVFISLTKCQSDLYKHYLMKYAQRSKQNILKDFHILQKIWSHPQVLHHFQMKERDDATTKVKVEKLEDDLAREDLAASEDVKPGDTEVWWLQYLDGGNMLDSLESSNKFVAVFRILDECVALGDKVLIFSTSLFSMDAMEYFLKKINNWSLGQEYYRLDGSVPAEVRQKWCREFNAEHNVKTKLFLISTRAGSLGLNMTAANRVIILDTSWNPAHDIQSIFRVYRFGQKKDCYIYRLVALGTMEQKIYERSVTKQAVACRVVDEQQIDRHYNMAELTELYRFDELGVGVAGGVAVGVRDVVLLRVARDAALHAVHEHDSLLRGSSEQALNETERDAAWHQFHEEYKHKQSLAMNPYGAVKMPVKRSHNYENKELPMIKQEDVKIEKDADYTPPEPKVKRGRKKNVVNCNIPIHTSTPSTEYDSHETITSDPIKNKEEILVEKISSILIQHNFHNSRGPQEISELIGNVRKIVATGQIQNISTSDELTMSIANVLLQKEEPSMPPLTDIYQPSGSTPSSIEQERPEKRRGRPRKKKDNEKKLQSAPLENEEITSDIIENDEERKIKRHDNDGRRKRRAAIAAEKHLDSIAKDLVIDLDDDAQRNDSDTDNESARSKKDKLKKPTVSNKSDGKKATKAKNSQKPVKVENTDISDSENRTQETSNIGMDSILLSDDEEPDEPVKCSEMTNKTDNKTPLETGKKIKVELQDTEVVPLHPSLLSNKNFIKIVAHTYLAGNPMLDEDAATLAAQYSTFRALQEMEATGKPIESGPIYDIAVKVLGISILKKLHKSGPSSKVSQSSTSDTSKEQSERKKELAKQDKKTENKEKATATVNNQSRTITIKNEPDEEKLKRPVKLRPKRTSELKASKETSDSGLTKLYSTNSALTSVAEPSSAPDIVPVGLIQSAPNIPDIGPSLSSHQLGDECILPDDDDVHIVNDPPSIPVPISLAIPGGATYPVHSSSPIEIVRRTSEPLILTSVSSKHKTAHSQVVKVSRGNIILTPEASSVGSLTTLPPSTQIQSQTPTKLRPVMNIQPHNQTPTKPALLSESISLDSDDEEEAVIDGGTKENLQIHSVKAPKYTNLVNPPVVPVSLTKANPATSLPFIHQESLLGPNFSQLIPVNQLQPNLQPTPIIRSDQHIFEQDKNIMIPADKFKKLTIVSKAVLDAAVKNPVTSTNSQENSQAPNVKQSDTASEKRPVTATKGASKLCKPGDIIRIGKDGKLEILNKNSNTSISIDDDEPVITSDAKNNSVSKSNKNNVVTKEETVHKTDSIKKNISVRSETQEKSSEDIRAESPSSSSSDSSRSPSPSDPLSILKDVVHIRADSYERPKKSANSNVTKKGPSTSKGNGVPNTKPSTAKVSLIGNTTLSSNKPSLDTIKSKGVTPTPSITSIPANTDRGQFIKQLSSKSDIILKKLHNILGPMSSDKNLNKTPTTTVTETVDLTGVAPKSSTIERLGKNITIITKADKRITTTNTSAKNISVLSKPDKRDIAPNVSAKLKIDMDSSTVVGTSSTIIINATGKPTSKAIASGSKDSSSARGIIRVTNMETVKPSGTVWSDPKKRPLVKMESNLPKKKKTEQTLTLKDFNIDDIDDIIELD